VTWDGGAGTSSWQDLNNWSSNQLPTSADDVVIPDLGTAGWLTRQSHSIRERRPSKKPGHAESVGAVGGTLKVAGNLSGAGNVTIAGGALEPSGTNWTNTLSIVLNSGTLNLGGSFTQFALGSASPASGQGTFLRTGGTVNLTGTLTGNLTLDDSTGPWNLGGVGLALLAPSSAGTISNVRHRDGDTKGPVHVRRCHDRRRFDGAGSVSPVRVPITWWCQNG